MVDVRFINDTTPIRVTSETQVKSIAVKSSMGTDNHDELSNRDLPDQHPISAITGLQEALDNIPDDYVSEAELEVALLEKQDIIRDLSEIRQGATLGATAVQPSELESYATQNWVENQGYLTGDLIAGLQTEITSENKLDADLVDDSTSTSKFVTSNEKNTWNSKQDTISDLATIRSGAAHGATAVQPSDLATVATSGNYDDLINKPTIPAAQVNADWNATSGVARILNKPTIPTVPTNVSAFTNDSGYITSSALSTYEQTLNKVTSISSSSTDAQYPSAKCMYDLIGDVETLINAL